MEYPNILRDIQLKEYGIDNRLEFAREILGGHPQTYTKWEKGLISPDGNRVVTISAKLQRTVNDMWRKDLTWKHRESE